MHASLNGRKFSKSENLSKFTSECFEQNIQLIIKKIFEIFDFFEVDLPSKTL